jgi:lysophospholipase L1-like esterase
MELFDQWRAHPERGFRLVGFGSSNTELTWHNEGHLSWFFWVACRIRITVGKHVVAVDCGICGDTTVSLLGRIDRDVKPVQPSLVIVTIGGNDLRNLTLEQYETNLREIVTRINAMGAPCVLQTYYCPMIDPAELRRFDQYMACVKKVSIDMKCRLVDHYGPMKQWWLRNPTQYKTIMLDEFHLNPKGHAVFGALCCASLGLPPPEWPARDKAVIEKYLEAVRA